MNMGVSLNTSNTTTLQRNYATSNQRVQKSQEKLSSGRKINRAGDDAAGLAMAMKLSNTATAYTQSTENARSGIGLTQVSDAALTEVDDMLTRMYSLSVQASNGIYGDEERAAMQNEFSQLSGEIDRIANSTNYNGIQMLNAQDAAATVDLAVDGSNTTQMSVPTFDMRSQALGLSNLRIDSAEGAGNAIDALRGAMATVSSARGDFGAAQNRLEHNISSQMNTTENLTSAESTVRDTDMAKEVLRRAQSFIFRSATESLQATANQNSYQVLQLLRG